MLIVAITGGIGAGKSTAVDMFKKHGVPIIDTDLIARDLVESDPLVLNEITSEFGTGVLDEQAKLNRARLREVVFYDEAKREKLQAILHPRIHQRVIKDLASLNSAYCIVVIPLLLESSQDYPVDRILLVDADEKHQIERATKRDNNQKELILKIMESQASRTERLKRADDIIENNGSLLELQKQVDALHTAYLKMADS